MIKPGAWRLLRIVGKRKYEQTDYFSHHIKHVITDTETGYQYICDPNDYVLFESKESFKLFENTHKCSLRLIRRESIYNISIDDIWVNQIMGGK